MKNVLVVGTGAISEEYCKVLLEMKIVPDVIGRNSEKAKAFGIKNNVPTFGGGVSQFLKSTSKTYEKVIVATGVMELSDVIITLLESGIKNILSEKPGGMNRKELIAIREKAIEKNANVYIAYNRRFYSSTERAIDIIKQDGGVKSFNFEFTEWSHIIEPMDIVPEMKENWFLLNSTHVVDLAFFLGGEPINICCYTGGEVNWHKHGCVYAGAGISDKNALFCYQANWASPGRWGVEILTSKHRLYFRPMEKLAIQELGSVAINMVEINDELDQKFKPGFYKETESFIYDINDGKKKTIQDQIRYMDYFEKIEANDRVL